MKGTERFLPGLFRDMTERDCCSKQPHILFITVDETHSAGEFPSGTDEFFGMAATYIRDEKQIRKISHRLRKRLTRKDRTITELKFQQIDRKFPHEIYRFLKNMARAGIRTEGVYVIKGSENRPEWWNGIETYERHVRVLLELLDESFSGMKDEELIVIIDNNDNYGRMDTEGLIKDLADCYRKCIEVLIEDSETGEHKELLQAHDCVSYVLGEHIRTGREDRIRIVDMNPKEITKRGRISNRQKLNDRGDKG